MLRQVLSIIECCLSVVQSEYCSIQGWERLSGEIASEPRLEESTELQSSCGHSLHRTGHLIWGPGLGGESEGAGAIAAAV